MRLVIIESQYAGDRERNESYLSACIADCVARGESPYASHAILTRKGVLDDNKPEERERGIQLGFAWRKLAHATVVYADLGVSRGMIKGIEDAMSLDQIARYEGSCHKIELRYLGGEWST